jgi:hypothetical protein
MLEEGNTPFRPTEAEHLGVIADECDALGGICWPRAEVACLDSHGERGWGRMSGRLCEMGDCYGTRCRLFEQDSSRKAIIFDRVY